MQTLETTLKAAIDGEIHFDAIHRKIYSVDASIYEVEPIGIVLPKSKQALIQTVKIAQRFRTPIIARGAATGITGGCLGNALIIDTSKYLNRILEINYQEAYAICEPGVVQDRLNEALAKEGYRLGPDTSTGNRATLGGMVANNSAGSRSLRYGTMADHLQEIEILLADGSLMTLQTLDEKKWADKRSQSDLEGHIYRELYRLRTQYHAAIQDHFPKIPRRVSGYNLDALTQDGPINFCRLFAGSEGTLGIATRIKLRIVKKAKSVGLCVLPHANMLQGMESVERMLSHDPMALEVIDDKIINMARHSPSMKDKLSWLTGTPQAIFIAEFDGETPKEVSDKLQRFANDMQNQQIGEGEALCLQDPVAIANIWEVRKSGLGLLLSKRSYSRAIAFLEDISVAPKELSHFMKEFVFYLEKQGKSAGIYGHVGSGCMHVRPYIDLRKSDDVALMEKMMVDVSEMLLKHGGALSGEHGDGRVRTWLNEKMFGKEIYQAFIELKAAFDPENRMNPGKIVHGTPFLQELRLDPDTKQAEIKTFLDFGREGGFNLSVDMCNGNGSCRKAEKVMCPSFQASGDEYHTTRARAQALRSIVNGRTPISSFTSQGIYDILDLCLECKGCKTECPSEVDMAKIKAEFLYHYQQKHGISFRSRAFAHIGRLSTILSLFPAVANYLSQTRLMKWLQNKIGIAPERSLPKLALQPFSYWLKMRKSPRLAKPPVVLFNDTYTEFFNPEIGQAAVAVLEALGYNVIVPAWQCCGRTAMSKGLLPEAQQMGNRIINTLLPFAENGIPIVGLEPSCILTIKDDYLALLPKRKEAVETVTNRCKTFDEFVADHLKNEQLPLNLVKSEKQVLLHGHCHQKALVGTAATMRVLKALPGFTVNEIPSGCCGMAGSFGYEAEHYPMSMQIAELKLMPAIRKAPDAFIIADGFSCRCQIDHSTTRKALHLAEIISDALEK